MGSRSEPLPTLGLPAWETPQPNVRRRGAIGRRMGLGFALSTACHVLALGALAAFVTRAGSTLPGGGIANVESTPRRSSASAAPTRRAGQALAGPPAFGAGASPPPASRRAPGAAASATGAAASRVNERRRAARATGTTSATGAASVTGTTSATVRRRPLPSRSRWRRGSGVRARRPAGAGATGGAGPPGGPAGARAGSPTAAASAPPAAAPAKAVPRRAGERAPHRHRRPLAPLAVPGPDQAPPARGLAGGRGLRAHRPDGATRGVDVRVRAAGAPAGQRHGRAGRAERLVRHPRPGSGGPGDVARMQPMPPLPAELIDAQGGFDVRCSFHLDVGLFRFANKLHHAIAQHWRPSAAFAATSEVERKTIVRLQARPAGGAGRRRRWWRRRGWTSWTAERGGLGQARGIKFPPPPPAFGRRARARCRCSSPSCTGPGSPACSSRARTWRRSEGREAAGGAGTGTGTHTGTRDGNG